MILVLSVINSTCLVCLLSHLCDLSRKGKFLKHKFMNTGFWITGSCITIKLLDFGVTFAYWLGFFIVVGWDIADLCHFQWKKHREGEYRKKYPVVYVTILFFLLREMLHFIYTLWTSPLESCEETYLENFRWVRWFSSEVLPCTISSIRFWLLCKKMTQGSKNTPNPLAFQASPLCQQISPEVVLSLSSLKQI